MGRYKEGGIYEAVSYVGKQWGVLVEVGEVVRSRLDRLSTLHLSAVMKEKIVMEHNTKDNRIDVIRFTVVSLSRSFGFRNPAISGTMKVHAERFCSLLFGSFSSYRNRIVRGSILCW